MGLFLSCLNRYRYCRIGGFEFTVFIRGKILFCASLVEKELTMGSAMILKPPLALQQHMVRHGWCKANLALRR